MPVSPKEVAAFVKSSTKVDEAYMVIDKILGSPEEKNYRHGDSDQSTEDDYYYKIIIDFKLTEDEHQQLIEGYESAGWPVIHVVDLANNKTMVKLFMNKYSKFFRSN